MYLPKAMLFAVLMFLLASNAGAITIAQTTADSLNVRAIPKGEVLFTLPSNSIVGIVKTQGNWALVVYLPGNDPQSAKQGWVSTSYLKVVGGNRNMGVSGRVSGDDCEYEYDSNAQVCISATNADLDCRKSYDRTYFKSCDIEVDYDVSTDYEGNDYLSIDVECEVEIKYKKRDGYSWRYDSDSESENHTLYSYGSESGDMDFGFTFSSYKEVVNVTIDGVDCEISSVYKY